MSRMISALLLAALALAVHAQLPAEGDFPKCSPEDTAACSGHGTCLADGECECHMNDEGGVYSGISCQCGGTEEECTADSSSGCHWCTTVNPPVCVISLDVCHALSLPEIETENGDGEQYDRDTSNGVPGGYSGSESKSNSMYFFVGSVLAIAAFAWYFKLRGAGAPIEDDMPPLRQRTSASGFEMHGEEDGL